jgi:ABC-2 type transport system permease protein
MMRFLAVIYKESILITRDKQSLFLILFFPVFMLLLYGYGITFDIDNVPVAVLDYSKSPASRDLINKIKSSGYLNVINLVDSYSKIEELLIKSDIILAFIFPPDFEKNLKSDKNVAIQVIANGSDANTANVALGYQAGIISSYGAELMMAKLSSYGLTSMAVPGVEAKIRVWYNTELKSTYFITPGVIAIVMMIMGSLLTSSSIVREKETGTIEMMNSTPIHPIELVLGKIIPYVVVSLVDVIIVVAFVYFLFEVPIKGSLLLLILGALVYMINALGFGLFISTVTSTVSASQILTMIISLLPSILLSGFVFPIESMPGVVQFITYAVPARYFITILRGIFLKGIGMGILWPQFTFLAVFGTSLLLISISRFKKRID